MKARDDRARWLAVWGAVLAAQLALRSGYGVPGLALLAAGWWGLRGQDIEQLRTRNSHRAWWLVGAALVLVALVLRLWRLESVPPVWWDEGVEGHDARCVAAGLPLEPLDGIYYHRGPVWLALLAAAGSVAGFSVFALRAVAAVAGTALVVAGGLAGSLLFGEWTGLLAAGWLAFHAWPLNMSRIMIGNILVPLAGAAIVWVAARPEWPWRRRAAVAGVIAGVSQYGYAAALQLPVLAGVALWLLAPRGERRADRLKSAALAAGLALACVAPYRLVYGGLWSKAANVSALGDPGMMAHNMWEALPLFHAHGDDDLRHQYPAGVPVLNTLLASCFTVGLALAVWNVRQARWRLLLLWLGLGLSPGLASAGGERNLFRMIGALPPVAILCAAGAATLPRALGARLGRWAAVFVWTGSAAVGLRTYFSEFPADRATGVWYRTYDLDAARDLKALAARRPLRLREPLTLTLHPLARLLLFEEMHGGRITTGAGREPLHAVRTYQDPYGIPQAVLLAAGDAERGAGPLPVALHTVLAVADAGDALLRAGRSRDAVVHYRRFVALLPGSPALHERLGFAALRASDDETARAAFTRAIALGSKFPATWDGLGQALHRLGRRAEAITALTEAARLGPSPEILADLERVRKSPAGRGRPATMEQTP